MLLCLISRSHHHRFNLLFLLLPLPLLLLLLLLLYIHSSQVFPYTPAVMQLHQQTDCTSVTQQQWDLLSASLPRLFWPAKVFGSRPLTGPHTPFCSSTTPCPDRPAWSYWLAGWKGPNNGEGPGSAGRGGGKEMSGVIKAGLTASLLTVKEAG